VGQCLRLNLTPDSGQTILVSFLLGIRMKKAVLCPHHPKNFSFSVTFPAKPLLLN
jgi:hypothetical protein